MSIIGFDTEAHLISPGKLAPPMVCYTEAVSGKPGGDLYHAHFDRELIRSRIVDIFSGESIIAGANTAFDAAVLLAWDPSLMTIIFDAYHRGIVHDVQLNQRLIDLAQGRLEGFAASDGTWIKTGYSLMELVRRHLRKDRSVEKSDPNAWRLRYAELEHTPAEEWPEEAQTYAIDDAIDARDVYECQLKDADLWEHQAAAQARASLALHLLSVEGVHTDADTIRAIEELTVQRFADLTVELTQLGLIRANGVRDTKKAKARLIDAYRSQGVPFPITDTGLRLAKARINKIKEEGGDVPARWNAWDMLTQAEREQYASLDAESCETSRDPIMVKYARRTSLATIVDTHIPDLWKGVYPGTPIQSGWVTLLESGRVSCRKGRGGATNGFQLMNPPRGLEIEHAACRGIGCDACKGTGEVTSEIGIREAFMAEPGFVFADGDFPGLELCTVAQACKVIVGYSYLGEAINAGVDVHLDLAAQLLGITYDQAVERRHTREVKDARQLAKPANFGFPGGLGPDGFVGFAAGYGVKITPTRAKEIKDIWLGRFSEFRSYFDHVRELCESGGGKATVVQLYSGRIRGGTPYCAACNTYFQGLGADGAKDALWAVTRACYDATQESRLFGCRPWNFVHDQILMKVPDIRDQSFTERKRRHDVAVAFGEIMSNACNVYLPDYPLSVKPALSYAWSKNAEPVFDRDGLLVPWDYAKAAKIECYYDDKKAVQW